MLSLSVLIPLYHGDDAVHFRIALDSILGQTVRSDDIVVVVDGPIGDELKEVVSRYAAANPEIRVLQLPTNGGLGHALQEALPHCRHDLVARMDADDIALPERFEKQLAFMAAHAEVQMLSGHVAEFRGTPASIVSMRTVPIDDAQIREFAKRENPMNHPAVLFRKNAVLEVGGYMDFTRHEDYYLWVRMLMAGHKAANLDEVLVLYRTSAENLKRRRSISATKAALRFHRWKRRVGFAGILDTCYIDLITILSCAMPDFIFERAYRAMRPAPSADALPSVPS